MSTSDQSQPIGWAVSDGLTGYEEAVAAMSARADAIARGQAGDLVWLLEHPPLYTAGTSAKEGDLLTPERFPVFKTGRGGQFTYHGPGQRVAYVMLDLRRWGQDVRAFVERLETWIIDALWYFHVRGAIREGRVGVWVDRGGGKEDKIAAIGIRVRKWVSFHGIALNVEPNLEHFGGIVPCGIREHGVTSLVDLGIPAAMSDADVALQQAFVKTFGPVAPAKPPMLQGLNAGSSPFIQTP